eukprot:12020821-Alexandrium_andersonii.AAC.1
MEEAAAPSRPAGAKRPCPVLGSLGRSATPSFRRPNLQLKGSPTSADSECGTRTLRRPARFVS